MKVIYYTRNEWQQNTFSKNIATEQLDLNEIVSLNDKLTHKEINDIYIPLVQFLTEKVKAEKSFMSFVKDHMLAKNQSIPFIIGITGGVSVGKSTMSRLLLELMRSYNPNWKVELITTDGYIYPKKTLLERDLMSKKGFPESYETNQLITDLKKIKSGEENVPTYTYSHLTYDRLQDAYHFINQPDVLIIEGVNIFQTNNYSEELVSDYLDYKIYLDAEIEQMKQWYVQRFFKLQSEAFQNKQSHFYQYKDLGYEETQRLALDIWQSINEINIKENIMPTRKRADLVLHKGHNHEIDYLHFQKI